jgi:uncharacterized protein YjiS (DUF1127 family)
LGLKNKEAALVAAFCLPPWCGGFRQTAPSTRHVSSLFKGYWDAFQERRKERRKRQRERAELHRLKDWELMDIGMTRGEIEYVVSNRSFDREVSDPFLR